MRGAARFFKRQIATAEGLGTPTRPGPAPTPGARMVARLGLQPDEATLRSRIEAAQKICASLKSEEARARVMAEIRSLEYHHAAARDRRA
ncbi:hypothetical protein [Sulfitobacter sp. S190]|uniref:hypothetical protein n=1 Tax=Sulfitobacter sp. S190 TaxID=2867022 RepID=UPI0021A53094|nr:hypothetical protein [Sulfitobacter sp. S190]UWR23476.1 hypothetical protein K3756_05700 [Sulfitobacter sp. S190]